MQNGGLQQGKYAPQPRRAGKIPPDEHQQCRPQRHEHAPAGTLVVHMQRSLPAQERLFQQQRRRDEHAVPQAEGDVAEIRSVPDTNDEVDDERRQRRGEDLARRAADVRSGPAGEFAEALESEMG